LVEQYTKTSKTSIDRDNELVNNLINENNEWEQTFKALPHLVAIIDTDHRIQNVNKQMADRLNGNPEDFIGKTCYSLVHNSEEPPDFCPHTKLLEDSKHHVSEFGIENLNGDFSVSVSPFFNENGNLKGSIHFVQDITLRKTLEKSRASLCLLRCGKCF